MRGNSCITAGLSVILILVLLAGCGDTRRAQLEAGVKFAKRTLERVGTDPLAGVAFQSQMETGGNPAIYVLSNLPDQDPVFTRFEMDRPGHPWTVVIRAGSDPRQYVIEGYGEDLTRPLLTEAVSVEVPADLR